MSAETLVLLFPDEEEAEEESSLPSHVAFVEVADSPSGRYLAEVHRSLLAACARGDLEEVLFWERVPGVNSASRLHFPADTTLIVACVKQNVDVALHLIENPAMDLNSPGQLGMPALHWATSLHLLSVVEALLAKSSLQVNSVDDEGDTGLHYAVIDGSVELVQLFARHPDIDLNVRNHTFRTPLHDAVSASGDAVISMRPNAVEAREKQKHVVEFLLRLEGLEVNAQDQWGNTALHLASLGGQAPLVELLLSHPQIQWNLFNQCGRSALDVARTSEVCREFDWWQSLQLKKAVQSVLQDLIVEADDHKMEKRHAKTKCNHERQISVNGPGHLLDLVERVLVIVEAWLPKEKPTKKRKRS